MGRRHRGPSAGHPAYSLLALPRSELRDPTPPALGHRRTLLLWEDEAPSVRGTQSTAEQLPHPRSLLERKPALWGTDGGSGEKQSLCIRVPHGARCSFASVGVVWPRSPGPWWAPWGGSHTPAQTHTQGDACCRTEQGAGRAWECAHLVTEGDGAGDQGLPLERALWCQLQPKAGAFRTEPSAQMCLYTRSVWRGAVHGTPANRPILVAICCRQPERLRETAAARGWQVREGSRPTQGGHCRGHTACPPGMPPTHFKAPAHENGCEKSLAAFFPSRDGWEECHCPWPLGNRYHRG